MSGAQLYSGSPSMFYLVESNRSSTVPQSIKRFETTEDLLRVYPSKDQILKTMTVGGGFNRNRPRTISLKIFETLGNLEKIDFCPEILDDRVVHSAVHFTSGFVSNVEKDVREFFQGLSLELSKPKAVTQSRHYVIVLQGSTPTSTARGIRNCVNPGIQFRQGKAAVTAGSPYMVHEILSREPPESDDYYSAYSAPKSTSKWGCAQTYYHDIAEPTLDRLPFPVEFLPRTSRIESGGLYGSEKSAFMRLILDTLLAVRDEFKSKLEAIADTVEQRLQSIPADKEFAHAAQKASVAREAKNDIARKERMRGTMAKFYEHYPEFANDSDFMRKLLEFHNKHDVRKAFFDVKKEALELDQDTWNEIYHGALVVRVMDS